MVGGWVSLNVFTAWLSGPGAPPIYIDGPFQIVPCACFDVNCHGWRIIPLLHESPLALKNAAHACRAANTKTQRAKRGGTRLSINYR